MLANSDRRQSVTPYTQKFAALFVCHHFGHERIFPEPARRAKAKCSEIIRFTNCAGESGGERAAVQTLRAVVKRFAFAKRLDRVRFSAAFSCPTSQLSHHVSKQGQKSFGMILSHKTRLISVIVNFPRGRKRRLTAAVQTLRAVVSRLAFAERLDCGSFSAAFHRLHFHFSSNRIFVKLEA